MFLFLIFYAKDIVDLLLDIAGTPYGWILTEDLPPLEFGSFNSVITVILGVCANGAVANRCSDFSANLAWNYIKLLFEAAERYILLGVLIYTHQSPLQQVRLRQPETYLKAGLGCLVDSFFFF